MRWLFAIFLVSLACSGRDAGRFEELTSDYERPDGGEIDSSLTRPSEDGASNRGNYIHVFGHWDSTIPDLNSKEKFFYSTIEDYGCRVLYYQPGFEAIFLSTLGVTTDFSIVLTLNYEGVIQEGVFRDVDSYMEISDALPAYFSAYMGDALEERRMELPYLSGELLGIAELEIEELSSEVIAGQYRFTGMCWFHDFEGADCDGDIYGRFRCQPHFDIEY